MPDSDVMERGSSGALFRSAAMDVQAEWLLGTAQVGGAAPGALLQTFARIKDGDPVSWTREFDALARRLEEVAQDPEDWYGAHTAWRASYAFAPPRWAGLGHAATRASTCFARYAATAHLPIETRSIAVPGGALPAWQSVAAAEAKRIVLIIGGGDTCVEDLWFLGGSHLVGAGMAVAMVDLPGQGMTPSQGLTFGPGTLAGLRAVIDDLHNRGFDGELVLLGWSGGGIFTTKYASVARPQDRLAALVASTPVHDAQALFTQAMPALLRRPASRTAKLALAAMRRRDPLTAALLARYDWQFGPLGLAGAVAAYSSIGTTDVAAIDVPVLALVGDAEATETGQQAERVVDAARVRHPVSRLIRYAPWTGAAGHCQLGNIDLAMRDVLQWLREVVG